MLLEQLKTCRTLDKLSVVHAVAYVGEYELLVALRELNVWQEGDLHPCGHGRTPLHYAAMSGSKKSCEILLKWGFGLDVWDQFDKTPLNYAPSIEFRLVG